MTVAVASKAVTAVYYQLGAETWKKRHHQHYHHHLTNINEYHWCFRNRHHVRYELKHEKLHRTLYKYLRKSFAAQVCHHHHQHLQNHHYSNPGFHHLLSEGRLETVSQGGAEWACPGARLHHHWSSSSASEGSWSSSSLSRTVPGEGWGAGDSLPCQGSKSLGRQKRVERFAIKSNSHWWTKNFISCSGAWSDGDSKWKSVDHNTKKEMGLHYMYIIFIYNTWDCTTCL